MGYVLVTPPVAEPLDLATARAHLRIDAVAQDDALILAAISAARDSAESQTQRQLVTATWNLVMDKFGSESMTQGGFGSHLPANAILLNKNPVQSVVSIRYLDMSGTWQTMPATDYVLDNSTEPARVTPVFGKVWPIAMPQIGAVIVQFVAGYGVPTITNGSITGWTGTPVPDGILNWIKLRVGSFYEYRQEGIVVQRGKLEPLAFIDRLLDPYTVILY